MAVDHDPTESVGHLDHDDYDYEEESKNGDEDDDDAIIGGSLHLGQRIRCAYAVQQVHCQLRLRPQVFIINCLRSLSHSIIFFLQESLQTCRGWKSEKLR